MLRWDGPTGSRRRRPYPARLEIDLPGVVPRWTPIVRLVWAWPPLMLLGTLGGWVFAYWEPSSEWAIYVPLSPVVLAPMAMIVLRRKYPRWWFDWNVEFTRFAARVLAYYMLLTHEFPSTDEEQSVHLEIDYPDVERDLNRWLPLVKWLLAAPHYVVLSVLMLLAMANVMYGYWAMLIGGVFPQRGFDFVVGVGRYALRVSAYAFLMTTDEYPPFGLS